METCLSTIDQVTPSKNSYHKTHQSQRKHLDLHQIDPGSYLRVREDVTDGVKQVVE